MPRSRSTPRLFLIVLLALLGTLLVTLPPKLIAGYNNAVGHSPWVGYLYLAVVSVGGLLLLGLFLWMFARLWGNTRRKKAHRERRGLNPSEMTATQKVQELADNLSSGAQFASGQELGTELRDEIKTAVAQLELKRESKQFEIVAFGTISSGKSSLLNVLAGREVFQSNVAGGTTIVRSEIPWPAGDAVMLIDTPGLAEIRGETRAAESALAAKNADLVLFVVDGPLKAYEQELLDVLAPMEKRIVICLNKEDWYDRNQQDALLQQIAEQVSPAVQKADIVAVRSRKASRQRIHVLPDGSEENQTITQEPDIGPLARRMMAIVKRDGHDLLLANLLLQSRGLVDEAKQRVLATLDDRAEEIIRKSMWAAGGATAVNPIPLLDLAGGSAITVKMVLDLAGLYRQSIDVDTIVTLLSQLGKNLIAMVGVSAATPALAAGVGSLLKTVPGIGTLAGGLVQGIVQAIVTRWIGNVFCEYFKNEMRPPEGGLAELAREKWNDLTTADAIRQLVLAGRQRLGDREE